MLTEVTLPYNGLALDRAGALRPDPTWVDAARAHPDSRVLALWRDACLVVGEPPQPVTLPASDAGLANLVLLGRDSDAAVFAADLSELDEDTAIRTAAAAAVVDIRRLYPTITPQQASTLAYARGILHWNRNQRYCGACGSRTESRDAGHLRACLGCGKLLFPRIEPAVIVLVEAPGTPRRCLLGRHKGAAADSYSTLAGFVEIGESLEDAVRREIAEEAGVRIGSVRYQASQSWPFPAGLMIGFRALAVSDVIAVDHNELEEARWFTVAEVEERLAGPGNRTDSIEHFLVTSWVQEAAATTPRADQPPTPDPNTIHTVQKS